MSPITITLALLGALVLIVAAYLAVDERPQS
jgi:hypothetical protein